MDIQYLMRQAKKLEKAMADAREKLSELSVDAEAGGGLVKVHMNGKCEVTRLQIDPKVLGDPARPRPAPRRSRASIRRTWRCSRTSSPRP